MANKREMSSQLKNYYKNKSMGLCATCGKVNDTEYTRCSDCIEKHREATTNSMEDGKAYSKNRYQMLKKLGLCVTCGKREAEEGKVRCTTCLYKMNNYAGRPQYMKHRKEKLKEEFRCVTCKEPLAENEKGLFTRCYLCRSKRYERKFGKHIKEDKRKRDRDRHNRKYDERKRMGLCVTCGKVEAVAGKVRCKTCADKQLAANKRHIQKQVFNHA